MRLYTRAFNKSKRVDTVVKIFVALWLLMSLLVSCSPYESNIQKNSSGITFVASTGSPPVDSITWSPLDMNTILVTAGDVGQGRAEVYLLDIQTGQKQVIANTKYGDFVSSTWAPDNKRILISVRDGSLGFKPGGIWIYDTETKSMNYFIDSGYAIWSPDNKSIATFSTMNINTDSERIDLNLLNLETKVIETIYTNNRAKYFWGLSWSHDAKYLVFGIGQDTPSNLYKINLDTRQTIQLTENTMASSPAWSPNGNIIAYESWPHDGTNTTLHLIDSNGKCDISIPNLEQVWSPTWSPDGKELGYIGIDGVYIMNINQVLGRDIYQNLCQ